MMEAISISEIWELVIQTNLHPFRFAITPDRFGSLEKVFYLREASLGVGFVTNEGIGRYNITHIWIGFIHKCIEKLHSSPYTHGDAFALLKRCAGLQVKGYGLFFCC